MRLYNSAALSFTTRPPKSRESASAPILNLRYYITWVSIVVNISDDSSVLQVRTGCVINGGRHI